LEIIFLGTKGEIQERSARSTHHSSFLLVYKTTRLLIEFGTNFSQADLDKHKPTHIIITHAHPDHAFGLLNKEKVSAELLLPQVVLENLKKKRDFKLTEHKTFSSVITAGDLTIKLFKTWHSTIAPSHGLIIVAGRKKIVYPSDVAWIPNMQDVLKDTWLYIGDASYFSGKSNIRKVGDVLTGHAPMNVQLSWCQRHHVKNVIFTHFGSWAFPPHNMRLGNRTYEDMKSIAMYLSRVFDMNIHLAYDGRTFKTKASTSKLAQLENLDQEVVRHIYADNESLPPAIRRVLPPDAQSIWREVFNAVYKDTKSDSRAASAAWAAVTKKYKKGKEGVWVKFEKRVLPGRYLVAPHAKLIWEGKKTLIVTTVADKQHINKPVYFMEDARVYGVLKITKISGPYNAKLVRFKLRHRHRITDEEWDKWAKSHPAWNKEVFVEEFEIVKKFDKPKYFEPAPGTERWVTAVELSAFNIDTYDPSEEKDIKVLRHMYAKAHAWWNKAEKGQSKFTKEQIKRFYEKVCAELKKRDTTFGPLPLGSAVKHTLEDTLPISGSGEELGEEVTLQELLSYYDKPFYEKRPFIVLTGGICNRGSTRGDFEFIVNHAHRIPERDRPVEFRIFRALPLSWQHRCSFKYLAQPEQEYGGPFTSHLPLFDRICIPSSWREVIHMEEMTEFFAYQIRLKELKEKQAIAEAQKARRTDQIEAMQFVIPAKPEIGHKPGERYSLHSIASLVKDYPAYVQKKYDGVRLLLMKDDKNVKIRLYTGIDVTKMLPGTVKEVQSWEHPEKVTIDSDSEIWREGKYVGREILAAYLTSKKTPNDDGIIHNIFDVLFFFDSQEKHDLNLKIGDLHKEPYGKRLDFLKLIPFKQSTMVAPSTKTHFNLAPTIIVKNFDELKKAMHKAERQLASEGAVIKWDKGYPFTGACYQWAKYKKTEDIHAIVLERLPTVVEGLYRYRVGIKIPPGWEIMRKGEVSGKEYMDVGKTGTLKKKIDEGTIVTVNYEELFFYIDPETQKRQLVVYVPHIVETRPEQNVPDSAEEAIITAKRRGLLVFKREALGYLSKYSVDISLEEA